MPMAGAKNKDPYVPQQPTAPAAPLDFHALMRQRFGGMYGSADVAPTWLGPSPQEPPMGGYGTPVLGNAMMPAAPLPPQGSPAAPPLPRMPAAPPVNPLPGAAPYPQQLAQGIFKQLYQSGRQAGGVAGDALMGRATPYVPSKQPDVRQDPMAMMPPRPGQEEPPRQMVPDLPPAPEPYDPRRTGPQGGPNPAAPKYGGRVGRRMADRAGQAGPMPRTRRDMPIPRGRRGGH